MNLQIWELLSYIVTVIGLPMAILVFALEKRKERQNEEDAVYESISEKYQEFLRVVLDHPDLHLFSMTKNIWGQSKNSTADWVLGLARGEAGVGRLVVRLLT